MRISLWGILFFSFISVVSDAQECLLLRQSDPYTRALSLSTGYHKWPGGSLLLDASKSEIDWMIEVGAGNSCFNDETSIQVFFEGTKLRLMFRNAGTLNCEGLLHVLFKNAATPTFQLTKLATLPIKQIVVTNSDKKVFTIEPTAEQRTKWMTAATCLLAEAPQLRVQ